MASDAVIALGVALSGLIISATGWLWLDPLVSLVISVVIVFGTWGLLRDSLNLALDGVPEGVDLKAVEAYLNQLPGVEEMHDLHIWGMSTTEAALTVHLVCSGAGAENALIHRACEELHDQFGIEHATIQIERGAASHPCRLASHEVV